MKIRFELREYRKQKTQPVLMVLTAGRGKAIKITVPNVKLHPNQWDVKTQRVKDTQAIRNRHEINATMNKMQATAQKVIDDILRHEPPLTYEKANEKIRQIYPNKRKQTANVEVTEKAQQQPKITFWQFVEKFIKGLPTKINPNGKITAKQTVKNYSTAISCLKQFEAKYEKQIDFHSFDVAFISEYKAYLTNEKQHKPNTIDKKVRTINSLLDYAFESDLHQNTDYKTRKEFKTRRENVDNVYLTESELSQIENYDFSTNERF